MKKHLHYLVIAVAIMLASCSSSTSPADTPKHNPDLVQFPVNIYISPIDYWTGIKVIDATKICMTYPPSKISGKGLYKVVSYLKPEDSGIKEYYDINVSWIERGISDSVFTHYSWSIDINYVKNGSRNLIAKIGGYQNYNVSVDLPEENYKMMFGSDWKTAMTKYFTQMYKIDINYKTDELYMSLVITNEIMKVI